MTIASLSKSHKVKTWIDLELQEKKTVEVLGSEHRSELNYLLKGLKEKFMVRGWING